MIRKRLRSVSLGQDAQNGIEFHKVAWPPVQAKQWDRIGLFGKQCDKVNVEYIAVLCDGVSEIGKAINMFLAGAPLWNSLVAN